MAITDPRLIIPDINGRVHLGDLAQHEEYIATVQRDGTMMLIPANLVSPETVERAHAVLKRDNIRARRVPQMLR